MEYSTSDKEYTILWFGDASCVTTGFGRVAQNVLDSLYKEGKYKIVQLGLNFYGDPHNKPYQIFPARHGDPYGHTRLLEVLNAVKPDILITNNDIQAMQWMAKYVTIYRRKNDKVLPWIAYFPIDGRPFRPEWVTFISDNIDIPITCTKWGQDVIKETNPDLEVPYIYHGVDTEVFKPNAKVKSSVKKELSKTLERDIDFVVGFVGRNQPRKRIPELMLAFKKFYEEYPNSLLYLHTNVSDMGWNLREVKDSIGLPDNSVLMTPKFLPSMGMDDTDLVALYQTFDLMVLPTVGEGFGLPIIESLSCGCPVAATDNSVIPELLDPILLPKIEIGYKEFLTKDHGYIREIPSVSSMYSLMKYYVDMDEEAYSFISDTCFRYATKNFPSWHLDEWNKYIDKAIETITTINSGLDFDLDFLELEG